MCCRLRVPAPCVAWALVRCGTIQIKLPADQVISIKAQQQLETTSEEDGAANEDEGDGVSDEDRAVQERVYKAVLEGIGSVVALMQAEPDNSVLQWWCCDGIASLCAGNRTLSLAVSGRAVLCRAVSCRVDFVGPDGCAASPPLSRVVCSLTQLRTVRRPTSSRRLRWWCAPCARGPMTTTWR